MCNLLKRRLAKYGAAVWGVPFWQDATELTSSAVLGQPVLDVGSTLYRNFEVGGLCAIIVSESSYEVGQIKEMTATSITLETDLTQTWAESVEVYPLLKGRLKGVARLEFIVPDSTTVKPEFGEVWDEDVTYSLGQTSYFPVYKTHPVMNLEPNWSTKLKQGFSNPVDVLRFLGKGYAFVLADYVDAVLGWSQVLLGREQLDGFKGFFNEMKGSFKLFWMSTQQQDLEVTAAFLSSASVITIEDVEYTAYWGSEDVYLSFKFKDGTVVRKKITSAPTSTTIQLDEAIGKACTAEDLEFLRVSFLYLVRFLDDTITFKYPVFEVAEVDMRGLRVRE